MYKIIIITSIILLLTISIKSCSNKHCYTCDQCNNNFKGWINRGVNCQNKQQNLDPSKTISPDPEQVNKFTMIKNSYDYSVNVKIPTESLGKKIFDSLFDGVTELAGLLDPVVDAIGIVTRSVGMALSGDDQNTLHINLNNLFKEFKTEILSEIEQQKAQDVMNDVSTHLLTVHEKLKEVIGLNDKDKICGYVQDMDFSLLQIQNKFASEEGQLYKQPQWSVQQLFNTGILHINIRNQLIVTCDYKDYFDGKKQQQTTKNYLNNYKTLLLTQQSNAIKQRVNLLNSYENSYKTNCDEPQYEQTYEKYGKLTDKMPGGAAFNFYSFCQIRIQEARVNSMTCSGVNGYNIEYDFKTIWNNYHQRLVDLTTNFIQPFIDTFNNLINTYDNGNTNFVVVNLPQL